MAATIPPPLSGCGTLPLANVVTLEELVDRRATRVQPVEALRQD